MSEIALVAFLAGLVPSAILVIAGIGHLRSIRLLGDDLRRQGVVPLRAVDVVAAGLPSAELVAGGAVIATVSGWSPPWPGWASHLAVVALYAVFTAYAIALLRQDEPGLPCGCGGGGTPVTVVIPVRAGVLGCLALLALATTPSAAGFSPTERLVAWMAAATFVTLAWTVPAALDHPARHPTPSEAMDVVHR